MEWILTKDKLPPVGIPLLVTIDNKYMNRKVTSVAVYQNFFKTENWKFFLKEALLKPEYNEVITWIEPSAPYEG